MEFDRWLFQVIALAAFCGIMLAVSAYLFVTSRRSLRPRSVRVVDRLAAGEASRKDRD